MQPLAPWQRRRIEELAEREDLKCKACGSKDLHSEEDAQITSPSSSGTVAEVFLVCHNDAAHPDGEILVLDLSRDQAKYVGIDLDSYGEDETGGY